MTALLGVNIDHVATLRQQRKEAIPNVLEAALVAAAAGATGITAHLREDRRHIQDDDIFTLREALPVPLNMEMAVSDDVLRVAEKAQPAWACLVPEKREELTTEGGLNVFSHERMLQDAVRRLKAVGTRVSFFIEPDIKTIDRVVAYGGDAVELHTGVYARLFRQGLNAATPELNRFEQAAAHAAKAGLLVNAGHGLDGDNIAPLMRRHAFHEFNIGFSIISRAVFVGLSQAVRQMKEAIERCAAS